MNMMGNQVRGPVFIWPTPRTGGTLLATMLGVNSELSMSYEIYEHYLAVDSGGFVEPQELAKIINSSYESDNRRPGRGWILLINDTSLRSFLTGCARSGLGPDSIAKELILFSSEGRSLVTLDDRLELIDRLMIRAMQLQGKFRWGGKSRASLIALYHRHPNAIFFKVVRDGRDMLASRLARPSFNHDVVNCAKEWMDSLFEFSAFISQTGVAARMVNYVTLVREPECELRICCELAGLKFDERMIQFERHSELPKRPFGHASASQLAMGLNDRSVGRWRQELDQVQLRLFENVAAPAMEAFGFERSVSC